MAENSGMEELRFCDYNPRKIDAANLGGLKESIEEFGDISGLTFNTRTGVLIAGHQRVTALKLLGATMTTRNGERVVLVQGKGDELHEFRVREVDWPIEKERRAIVAANNPRIQGEFTEELTPLLEVIREDGEQRFEELLLDELYMDHLTVPKDEDTAPRELSMTFDYRLVFDDEEQSSRFQEWLRDLKERYPDAVSIAARVDRAIREYNGEVA